MMPGRVLFSDLDPCKKDGDNKLIAKDMLQKSKTHGQAFATTQGQTSKCHKKVLALICLLFYFYSSTYWLFLCMCGCH